MTTRSRSLQLHVPGHEERKISWLELFYDLIYVATIIQLGNMLVGDPTARGALLFVFLFVPVWWSWTGLMFFFNRFVVDDVWHRVLVFAQMFAIANMAISVTGAFADTSVAFALSYFAVRALLVVFYARAWLHVPGARALIERYGVGFSFAALCWLASAFVPEPYRYVLWVVGLALEFSVPLSAGSRRLQHLLPPDAPHVAERYGLFTIIVLGESFIKVVGGLADHGVTLDTLVLSGLGFVVAACVWWLYFGGMHGAVLQATTRARYLWIYAHLPLTIGITGIGVGLKKLTVLPLDAPAPDSVRWLLGGAVVLCLLAFVVLDSVRVAGRHRRGGRETAARLAAAAAVLALAALGGGASALTVALLVAAACALQVLFRELVAGSDDARALGQTAPVEPPH
jgi:low temperature requirement protein LtrA